jgi:hypothetical protein
MMLRLFWMMFGAPALAAAFRADIMSDTNSSGGDEMCCCYKEKQAYRNLTEPEESSFILVTLAHSQHVWATEHRMSTQAIYCIARTALPICATLPRQP